MFPDLDASVVYDVRLELPLKRVVLIRYTVFLQPQVPVTFDLFFLLMLCLLGFTTCCNVESVDSLVVLFI